MKTHAKRIYFQLGFLNFLLWIVVCSFGAGEEVSRKNISSIFDTTNNEIELCVPKSLRKCLKTKLGVSDVGNIRETSYVVRGNTYLGIDGSYLLDNGSILYYSFVFSVSNEATSWENAKVYRGEPTLIKYKDSAGQIINVDVDTVNSLVILPENILTNYLWEISSIEESVWSKEAYKEWCRRMSRVTINPEKRAAHQSPLVDEVFEK